MSELNTPLPTLDNQFVKQLPADPVLDNFRRQVNRSCYSLVRPCGFPNASTISYTAELAGELGLSPDQIGLNRFTAIFSGSEQLADLESYACCYGGHQFGHWAGQLGDGRAINLGEVLTKDGQHQILQLKGAGPTPYSRSADGLAVLRSSVREYLCSEAMHHLGVPTTRALSLISTGENVLRDMFYDGNPEQEPGAVVCRVAPSFVRFGSFEIFTSRQEPEQLRQLADFTIRRDFPELLDGQSKPDKAVYLAWFNEVCQRTASLMVHWMRVGFVHGVMNTDNMSILGLTIDYGPYGWLENYDTGWTPNTTDAGGKRYRFGQQPQIGLWNLLQLANALYPLIEAAEPLEAILNDYKSAYETQWLVMQRNKLGLQTAREQDKTLVENLYQCLGMVEADMTLFFRALAKLDFTQTNTEKLIQIPEVLSATFYLQEPSAEAQSAMLKWLNDYRLRISAEGEHSSERVSLMNATNPLYVLRNWLAQLAIDDAAEGNFAKLNELQAVLKHPYEQQPGKEHLAAMRPDWARERAGCSMLSCSS